MVLLSDSGGNTGGGGGGTGMGSPTEQKDTGTFNDAVTRTAKSKTATSSTVGGMPSGHGTAKDPLVYLGTDYANIAFVPMSQASQMYYHWDAKTKNKFLSQLQLAGYDTGTMKDNELGALWAQYVQSSARYSTAGKWVSPWEVMGKDIAQREVAAAKPKTVTQTATQYNLSTAEDAHALFQGAAQTLLGRDPTKSEIARFKSVLNKYEKANPTTTTTTSNYIGSDLQSQSSTTSGGVDSAAQQMMAQEEAKKNPEYGAYQASTNGMNWLMQMIGGG